MRLLEQDERFEHSLSGGTERNSIASRQREIVGFRSGALFCRSRGCSRHLPDFISNDQPAVAIPVSVDPPGTVDRFSGGKGGYGIACEHFLY